MELRVEGLGFRIEGWGIGFGELNVRFGPYVDVQHVERCSKTGYLLLRSGSGVRLQARPLPSLSFSVSYIYIYIYICMYRPGMI